MNGLDPKAVRVELYADGVKGKAPFRQEMQHVEQLPSSPGCHAYCATVCAERAAADYTVRVIPYHDGVAIPLEEASNPVAAIMQSSPRELDDYISQTSDRADVRSGSPLPFGTEERDGGVNFAIFSRNASRVRLEFFLRPEDAAPSRTLDLDSKCNRTGDVWHVWVKGIVSGQLYGYRMDGPYEPGQGHRFNFNRLLLDPRATAVSSPPQWDFASALGYDPSAQGKDLVLSQLDNAGSMPKCVFVNDPFDWQGDKPPRHPWSKTVIYEMHVRGFTIRPQSGVDHPGTYRGLMEKIPYLKTLGSHSCGTDAAAGVR